MTDRRRRARELLRELADLPVRDREAALARACADDPDLRAELAALASADPTAGDHTLTMVTITTAGTEAPLQETVGSTIGPYRLLRLIGQGGFGSVFQAEQSAPVRRQVALKIIKLGMDTRQVVARFEQERQTLALMDHPGIATVLDAGATETGRPYFVMELVEGRPMVAYCDAEELSVAERLELFADVCSAVQHAHGKGIIHRDIKSSNVLVGLQDGRPRVQVIDFGIAKATGAELAGASLFTTQGQFIGTPEFMSPEQAAGSLDIDTRTDVYSLGVLLYELLTSSTPFDFSGLRASGLGEIQRIIRDVDPPRPSTRLDQSGTTLAGVAARRHLEAHRLSATIRGELDWIVMKAMEKDRDRRYATANELAMDIRRYLDGEAVEAAPPSAVYRLRKLVRRHRAVVAAGGAVAAALVVGLVAFAWQAGVARDQRDRAVQAEAEAQVRADEIEQVANFQARMLSGIDATEAGEQLMQDLRDRFAAALAAETDHERSARAASLAADLQRINATDAAVSMIDRTILQPAVVAVADEFTDQPLVAASLRQTLADLYRALGRYDQAMPLQEQAVASRRELLGDVDPATLISLSRQGLLLMAGGEMPEAEAAFRMVADAAPAAFGEDHPEALDAVSNLGTVIANQGRLAEAEPFYREALARSRRLWGDDHEQTIVTVNNMGFLLDLQGKFTEAEALYREGLERCRRLLGDDHRWTLSALSNMGVVLQEQGRLDDAEPYYREALATSRRVLGEDHPETLTAVTNLGALLKYQGKPDAAEPYYRESLERRRRVLGGDHPETLISLHNLGSLRLAQADTAEAERCYREALAGRRQVLGAAHPSTLNTIVALGSLLDTTGRPAEAARLLSDAEDDARATLTGARTSRLARLLAILGGARMRLGDHAAAEGNLLEVEALYTGEVEPPAGALREITAALVDLYTAWDEAEPGAGHLEARMAWQETLEGMPQDAGRR